MKRFKAMMLRGRGGNVALITAILAPVIVLLAGGVVDLTNASMRQAQLQAAADAAAIAAVARNSQAYTDAVGSAYSTSTTTLSDPLIAQQAQAVFNADLQNTHDATPTFSVVVTKTGTAVSSTVTTTSSFAPAFLGLIGRSSVALAATSYATDNIPAYMNFYMLLDNTPSMGLGATDADTAIIQASNSDNCSFACHATAAGATDDYYTKVKTYAAANNESVQLRIDVVALATQNLTGTALATEQTNGISKEFQMAVYDFGTAAFAQPALNQVGALSSDLTPNGAVATAAASVTLETVPDNNYAYTSAGPPPTGEVSNNDMDTSFDFTMTQLGNIMVAPTQMAGNGTTANSPIPILFLVTDGMVDQNNGGRQMGGINPATCSTLKQRGIVIAILYTTYDKVSINNDPTGWSQANAVPLLPQISPALQACSSGPQYFEPVSPSQGISQAMQNLFNSVVAQVKITH